MQRKYTKFIDGPNNLSYEERLKLQSLEYRRLRGVMIQLYKIAHSNYDESSIRNLKKMTG